VEKKTMIKKLLLAMTLATATLITTPATAQTEDAPEVTAEAPATETAPAPTEMAPESEAAEGAPDSEAESSESKDEGNDLGMLGQETIDLGKAGKWVGMLGAFMLFLVAMFRKVIFARVAWFQTKRGGYAAAGGIALGTIIGLSIKLGFSIDAVLAGLSAAGLATGLHTIANDASGAKTKPGPGS